MKLKDITAPSALRACTAQELADLAQEIRHVIIDTVAANGGHLSSNLGVVELTLALHRAFDCPTDQLVWDVGHQCYTHKLLTGRYEQFHTLRCTGGVCGFPRHAESPYDVFDVGHASTSISAALGLARARDLQGKQHHVVAVVGDGALTGGMCYEALNDAGSAKIPLIVVLNDNGMSISSNVGAMSAQLTHLRTSKGWMNFKRIISGALRRVPLIGGLLYRGFQRVKNSIRNVFVHDKFFTALGFRYFGPIDGHDVQGLERTFRSAKAMNEPVLVHVITQKGNGFVPAEELPEVFHGTPPFRVETGEMDASDDTLCFGVQASNWLAEAAKTEKKIAVVTAAMTFGTGFTGFAKAFPDRLFDVGIAEEHAVTMAAGMARGGMRPFVAIYDSFLQRGYDQLMEDVAEQNLPVCLLMDREGLGGNDGTSHHGVFGTAYLRHIPGMMVLSPRCVEELQQMLQYALTANHPVAIRYPRAEKPVAGHPYGRFTPGKWEVLTERKGCAILAVSSMVAVALQAAEQLKASGIEACVINASSIKPLDENMLRALQSLPVFTLEEHVAAGGFGSAVAEFCAAEGLPAPRRCLALPDQFIPHGARQELLEIYRLDAASVAEQIQGSMR